jgi:iduronate 2-sulfatase
MSGWRVEHTKIWGNQEAPRPQNEGAVWMQEYFHDHGYFTARVGKIYHSRFENEFEWDIPAGARVQRPAQSQPEGSGRPAGQRQRRQGGGAARRGPGGRSAITAPQGGPGRGGEGEGGVPITWTPTNRDDSEEADGRIARSGAELIEQHKAGPFFIGVGFLKPHLPWVCPSKYFDMYPPETMRFEPNPPDDLKDIPRLALVPVLARDPHSDVERQQAIAAYQACTTFVDTQVGLLLDTLDRLKLWDNTIVVFWGDHGWQLGEHGLWRKMTLFEESARAPLIIVTPGAKQPGAPTRELAEFIGIYPTLVELCGLPPVKGLEGVSLVPLLQDPVRPIISAAFTVVARGNGLLGKSVRTDRYRYTEWPDGSKELYDHQNDPHEFANLAGDSAHQSDLAMMSDTLKAGFQAAVVRQ